MNDVTDKSKDHDESIEITENRMKLDGIIQSFLLLLYDSGRCRRNDFVLLVVDGATVIGMLQYCLLFISV